MPAGKPACDLATDGFLNCPLSKATVGYLVCPVVIRRGGSSKKRQPPLDKYTLQVRQEDEDVLAIIIASINIIT